MGDRDNEYSKIVEDYCFVMEHLGAHFPEALRSVVYAYKDEYEEELFADDSGWTTADFDAEDAELYASILKNNAAHREGGRAAGDDEPIGDATDDVENETEDDDDVEDECDDGKYSAKFIYGWLSPAGVFHEVPWCHHEEWAGEYVREHYPISEYESLYFDDIDGMISALTGGDILVYRLGWILMNSPMQGVATHTANPNKKMTKKQREWLWEHYAKCGLDDLAQQVWENEYPQEANSYELTRAICGVATIEETEVYANRLDN